VRENQDHTSEDDGAPAQARKTPRA
jgi:hypothetical protein